MNGMEWNKGERTDDEGLFFVISLAQSTSTHFFAFIPCISLTLPFHSLAFACRSLAPSFMICFVNSMRTDSDTHTRKVERIEFFLERLNSK